MNSLFHANGDAPTRSYATSKSLISRLKADDATAWERMVKLYGPLIYHWCRKCGLSAPDSADITQETFQQVAAHISGFRQEGPEHTFRGWLWTITRNKIRDHARKNRDSVKAVGGTDMNVWIQQVSEQNAPPDDDAQNNAVTYLVQRAMEAIRAEFNDRAWKAFILTVVNGYTAPEAAEAVEMTPQAVRKVKSRMLRRLREELGDVE